MNRNRLLKLSAIAIITLTVTGCNTKDGSFFNILQLPGVILDSVFDNHSCHIKKEKVKNYVEENYEVIRKEIKDQKGEYLDEMMKLAEIKTSDYIIIKKRLHNNYQTIFKNSQRVTEKLVQIMSRLYEVKEKRKTINGFSYTEISEITKSYIDKNFEEIRLAIKNGKSEVFIPLAKQLNIKDKLKREKFIKSLNEKHFELYDDLLVVAVMVEGM